MNSAELVVQVVGGSRKIDKYMSVRTVGIFGGVNINTQKKQLFIPDVIFLWNARKNNGTLDNVIRFEGNAKVSYR
jgi:ATP-dependent RNA helicase RhlE